MIRNGCATSFNIQRVAEAPGNDIEFDTASRVAHETNAFTNEELNWSASRHYRQAVDAVNNYTDGAEFSAEVPTKGDTSLLGKAADDFMQTVVQSEAETREFVNSALQRAGATNTSQLSWAAKAAANLSSKFLHGLGDLYKWEASFFGQDGQTSYDMLVMGEAQMMTGKLEATRGIIKGFMDEFHASITNLANRAGLPVAEMGMKIGDLAIYEHMVERNPHILKQWKQEYARLAAKSAIGKLSKTEAERMAALPEYIRGLEDNIDADAVQLNEHGKRVLRTGGYTNGEAVRLWNDTIKSLGLTPQEAEAATASLRDMYIKIRDYAAQAGILSSDAVSKWPNTWQKYVPVKTKSETSGGPTGDASIYDAGSFYAANGMNDTPIDAYTAIAKFGERVANNVATKDLGNVLKAMLVRQHELRLDNPEFNAGLVSYKYSQVLADLQSKNPAIRAAAELRYKSADGGGIVVEMPVRNKDGSVGSERRLIMFDPEWSDANTGVTGGMLNQALTRAMKFGARPENVVARGMMTATSGLGQLVTRFTPLFAPANMNRDAFERMSHLAGRTIKKEDGTVINSGLLVSNFALNMPKAGAYLLLALNRKLKDGLPKQWVDEFMKNGLHYQPTAGLLQKKTEIGAPELKGFMQRLQESSMVGENSRVAIDGAKWIVNKLDGWNDYFNNIAPLAHYMTLREAGVGEARASRSVMEMMNLYQTGTATQALSMFFPFVRPTMQAGAAMARTFGLAPNARGQFQLNKKGWAGFMGMTLGYSMLMPIFREMMGTDEQGNYRFDLEPLENLMRATPLAVFKDAKEYVKIPNGFGPMQTAIALSVGFDRWQRGLMSTEDMVFNTVKSVVRNVSPADWPAYSISQDPIAWIFQSLSPMAIRPALDVALNKNFAGRNITYGTNDPSVAKALQGRTSTPDVWHDVAKTMLQTVKLDLAPEQWRQLFEGYSKGPLRVITELMKDENLRASGLDKTARDELGPALTALGATMFYGKQANSEMIAFYNKFDELNEAVRFAGIKITSDVYGSDKDKRRAYQTALLKEHQDELGWSDAKIKAYLDMREANQALRKISQDFGRKHRSNSDWLDSEESIREAYGQFNRARIEEMERAMEEYYMNMIGEDDY